MTEQVADTWLALREPSDYAARSRKLAHALADALPARPHVLDLGAGTGSLFRYLAPIIGRAQVWYFVDDDGDLLDEALSRTAHWAERHRFTVTWPDRAMIVHTPRGAWRIECFEADLADAPDGLPLDDADAVVCSALLDLVSGLWLGRLLEWLDVPLLATMTMDGRDAWLPHHPSDAILRAAVRRDQRRDHGFGPALGTAAPAVALRLLQAAGFATISTPSDWHIPRTALAMARMVTDATANVASEIVPARRAAIDAWAQTRLRQATAARLAIRIGHRDILAMPPGE